MSWEPPCRTSQTLFICQADRTHPSDEGVLCPSWRLHGPSRPDTALCPLISRDWRPVGPVRRLRELSHCSQLGSSWPGLQPRCSSIGGQGSPIPTWWAIAGPRFEPSPTGRSKTTKFTPACHTSYSSELAPARSQACIWGGGDLSLAAVLLCFWGGTLGSGHSWARSHPPGQHAYNVLPYSPNTHYV